MNLVQKSIQPAPVGAGFVPIYLLKFFIEVDKNGSLLDSCFKEVLSNDKYVVITSGQYVHVVELSSMHIKSIYLADFVGRIYSVPDHMQAKLSDNFIITTYCYFLSQ